MAKNTKDTKKKKPRQRSKKASYKKEQFEKFLHQNKQFPPKQPFAPQQPQVPSTKAVRVAIFLKLLPYILASMLAIMIKYKDIGGVIARAMGDAYIKDSPLNKDKNFKEQTKLFIDGIIKILSGFDNLELLAFSTSLFAFFAGDVPKIIKNAQNIQGIPYTEIYASIFKQLLSLRDMFGGKLGMDHKKAYPL